MGMAMHSRAVKALGLFGTVAALGWMAVLPQARAQASISSETTTVRCPGRVSTLALAQVDNPGNGFVATLPRSALSYLVGIAVVEGPPERRAALTPAKLDGKLQWSIETQHQRPEVVCRYEGGVLLARTLEPKTRLCVTRVSANENRLGDGASLDHAVAACS